MVWFVGKIPNSVLTVLSGGLLALSAAVNGAPADRPEDVYGIWATSGTMIEVRPEGDGLSARIVALKNPVWREKDGVGVAGEPKTDLHNPDPTQHGRPLIGLEMLKDYEFRKGRWHGRLYLPSNGTTWTSSARVKNGKLLLRGYVGVAIFGRTQTFAPLSSCNEDILRMISSAALADTPCDDLQRDGPISRP